MEMDAKQFNQLFISRLDTPDGIAKAAEAGGSFCRERLRELSFARKIIQPQNVTKADCQRSVNHDMLVKIVDIEPGSTAMALNFKGAGNHRYIQGLRYEIPFHKVESDKFEKQEGELLAYDYPVTKVIEDNSIKDIWRIEDINFLSGAKQLVDATGKLYSSVGPINRHHLIEGFKLIDNDELAVDCILMHKTDWDDWMKLPAVDVGDQLAGEVTVNGYKYNTILGHKLIVTIKTLYEAGHEGEPAYMLVGPGHMWLFTAPKFLGNSYILNDTKFWIKKEADIVTWKAWEYIGAGFGNRRSVARIILT